MNDSMNFQLIERGCGSIDSNYRLLGQKVPTEAKIYLLFEAPGTPEWENEGGACAPTDPIILTAEEIYRSKVRVNVGRKQRAARCVIKKETIKRVDIALYDNPRPLAVVEAIIAGKEGDDLEIVKLEARIAELMGIVRKPELDRQKKLETIAKLESLFEARRLR